MATLKGGARLETYLRNLSRNLKAGNGASLRVGFLEGATYPGGVVTNQAGKQVKSEPISVATVAAAQNFGTDTIPARPFFSNMIREKSSEWGPGVGTQLKINGYDVLKTLSVVGVAIKGQLQQSILDTNAPPLAESTIAAKGFDKPLIDTAVMIRSVDFEVKAA